MTDKSTVSHDRPNLVQDQIQFLRAVGLGLYPESLGLPYEPGSYINERLIIVGKMKKDDKKNKNVNIHFLHALCTYLRVNYGMYKIDSVKVVPRTDALLNNIPLIFESGKKIYSTENSSI